MDIIQTINDKFSSLSPNQQKVAQYILINWEKVCYESAITIAETLGVSQSTVIRTASALEFDGFPSLQNELRKLVTDRVSIINILDKARSLTSGQGMDELITQIFRQHGENLDATLRQIDPQRVKAAAAAMVEGRKLFVIGMRSSGSAAHYLGFNASMVRRNVIILDSDYNLVERMLDISAQDTVLCISFSRYTKLVITAMKWAKKMGATLIGITDASTSPLVGIVKIPFIVGTQSTHFNLSHIGVVALVDVLLTSMTLENKETTTKKLQEVERSLQRFDAFT